MMRLPRDGVEYAIVTFSDYPTNATAVEASLDRNTWHPFDIQPVKQPDNTWIGKVLLRGPAAPTVNGLPVADADTILWARITDTPEIVPVECGQVALY